MPEYDLLKYIRTLPCIRIKNMSNKYSLNMYIFKQNTYNMKIIDKNKLQYRVL